MLPFIGSITSNCCSILTQQQTREQEDLDGGILTIIGLRIANRNNTIKRTTEKSCDNDYFPPLTDNDNDNIDNNMMESSGDIVHFQRTLTRSAESLYPSGINHLQSSSMRRYSHNLNSERRRLSLWTRPTLEEMMTRVNRRVSDGPRSLHSAQYDPVRGLTPINLPNF
ncbi:unnamed protein product [Cercopithifilaria johnstoni]|uniref:Uncharacterized protein n=1 Tax=Cercopithifilaria johnstoni TaxID=2874296 RepID=A0A8J2M8C2_9BILA|nr:unnamed protein product [Cercopithifilaria johnstoni]